MTSIPEERNKARRLIELRSLTSMRYGNVLPLTGIEPFFPLQTIESTGSFVNMNLGDMLGKGYAPSQYPSTESMGYTATLVVACRNVETWKVRAMEESTRV